MASYNAIGFVVIGYGNGALNPQWEPGELQWAEFPIAGGTQTVVQSGGRMLETLEVIVRATHTAFHSLKESQGVTLRTLSAMPTFGRPTPAVTTSYTNVMLKLVREPQWWAYAPTSTARGILTFKRQYASVLE